MVEVAKRSSVCLVSVMFHPQWKPDWEVHVHNQGRGEKKRERCGEIDCDVLGTSHVSPMLSSFLCIQNFIYYWRQRFDRSLILSTAGEDLDLNEASFKGGNWEETFVSLLMIKVHNNSCWNLLYIKINDFWNWIEEWLSRACFSLLSPK